jgi:hypothetical protein
MKRRLYFSFPDARQAQRAVDDLRGARVPTTDMHAMARPGVDLGGLPRATGRQCEDSMYRLDKGWWNGNLVLFWVAFVAFLLTLPGGFGAASAAALVVMAVSFALGLERTRLPDVHLDEFRAHGEVLLMVDVARGRVKPIEDLILRRHPEAATAGVGLTLGAFGV